MMILRLRTQEGQARLEIAETDDLLTLRDKFIKSQSLPPDTTLSLSRQQNGKDAIRLVAGKTVAQAGLRNGDVLFVSFERPVELDEDAPMATSAPIGQQVKPWQVKQHPIDDLLESQDGSIKRSRSTLYVSSTIRGPVAKLTDDYMEENKIKHLSFHAYLRKLIDQNKTLSPDNHSFIPPLKEDNFQVDRSCRNHPPYPEGICTKCQPSAITLQPQVFRLLDHVEFSSPSLIDTFLQFWRFSGLQRFGYLYGKYEQHPLVPLGVKAIVEAIYEPPQENFQDGMQLQEDPNESNINAVAKLCGLEIVGMIYSDCVDDGTGEGKVLCKRHGESWFMSSSESIFCAKMQEKFKVKSRYSRGGVFGSRFVNVIVSGNADHNIDLFSYQVSNTCMSMVRDNIVEATTDPNLMRVMESTAVNYVPEVFYKQKNEYNVDVKMAAKPTFPVEYLLVTVTHGFPSDPNPLFRTYSTKNSHLRFSVENRSTLGELQDPSTLRKYLDMTGALGDVLSDFHLLLCIRQMGIVSDDDMAILCKIATTPSTSELSGLVAHLVSSPGWQTLTLLLQEHAPKAVSNLTRGLGGQGAASAAPEPMDEGAEWQCEHCTFINQSKRTECEVCGLPPA